MEGEPKGEIIVGPSGEMLRPSGKDNLLIQINSFFFYDPQEINIIAMA